MGYGTQEYENTALAAKYVAERADKSMAAIGSLENARRYGLEVLESNINNAATNTTRFAALSRVRNEPAKDAAGEYFILVFTVKNEAGALAKVLNIIGAHGFNMTNLRSRPMKKGLWNHFFYAELEGSAHSGSGRELLTQLNTVCSQLKLVGTYKRM
jgi:chorismate mutase/prephenate dehydratase